MAARTAQQRRSAITPPRRQAPLSLRIAGTLLISLAFAISVGVPLLLSGVTGFHLWLGEGESMEPTFYDGDFMITRHTPVEELAPGEIILFELDGRHVMHRIVSIETGAGEPVLTTRGDNNDVDDAPVPAHAVIGRLCYDLSWLPRSPVDLSGTGLFVAEWLLSVLLVTAGVLVRRSPARPRPAPHSRPSAAGV